jgi:hypothetical protein
MGYGEALCGRPVPCGLESDSLREAFAPLDARVHLVSAHSADTVSEKHALNAVVEILVLALCVSRGW